MPNYSHGIKMTMAMSEEPPYLKVGTDVSAKYKGAFCEAKITDVKKHVKLRVSFDGSSRTYLIDDTDLKPGSSLETGTKIEAKHPESIQQTFVQATVTKILDHSRYTVIFDDGDQCILRRNSICLKSGKHFDESETLDQLPLTNPEHFGNPVKIGAIEPSVTASSSSSSNSPSTTNTPAKRATATKGRRRRESVTSSTKTATNNLDNTDSQEDSSASDANSASDSGVRSDLIETGVKLMVKYGEGKMQNVYEAKVNKIETNPAGKTRYFVHYTGWNNRYDEWINRNRILSIVTEKENGCSKEREVDRGKDKEERERKKREEKEKRELEEKERKEREERERKELEEKEKKEKEERERKEREEKEKKEKEEREKKELEERKKRELEEKERKEKEEREKKELEEKKKKEIEEKEKKDKEDKERQQRRKREKDKEREKEREREKDKEKEEKIDKPEKIEKEDKVEKNEMEDIIIDEFDCDKRISILEDRIMALRQKYISLKTELNDLDRRRKRARTSNNNSEIVSCG